MAEISYICSECGARGVRLWRQYQTFLNHIKLKCRGCSDIEQAPVLELKKSLSNGIHHCANRLRPIGGSVGVYPHCQTALVPFGDIASAPKERWDWWGALPEKNLWKKGEA